MDPNNLIVRCPGCEARFSLARERVPAKGARVRCSRCQHRFVVSADGEIQEGAALDPGTGSTGATRATGPEAGSPRVGGAPAPAARPGPGARSRPGRARSESTAGATTPHSGLGADDDESDTLRSPWSMRAGPDPKEDQDLDNPEFLFDGSAAEASGAGEPGEPDVDEGSQVTASDAFEGGFSLDDSSLRGGSEEHADVGAPATDLHAEADIPDIRAQKDELAAQRALAALDAADHESEADDANEPLVTRNEDWMTATRDEPVRGRAAAQPHLGADLSEDDEGDSDDPFELGSATPAAAVQLEQPGSLEDAGLDLGAAEASGFLTEAGGLEVGGATSRRETVAGSVTARVPQAPRGAAERRDRSGFEGTSLEPPRTAQRFGGVLALLVGVALVAGILRSTYVGYLRVAPAGAAAESEALHDVTVRHLQGLRGERVLVIEGAQRGGARSSPPAAVLLDPRGRPLGEPVPGRRGGVPTTLTADGVSRLARPAEAPASPSAAAEPFEEELAEPEAAQRAAELERFSIVIAQPDPRARRFELIP